MAQAVYVDEDGAELWQSQWGELVPPGTLVTGPEGDRYLVAKLVSTPREPPGDADLTVTLRRLEDRPRPE